MEYNKDTILDGTVYERFEGTPEEIAELVERLNGKEEQYDDDYWDYMNETYLDDDLTYDTDDAIDYIYDNISGSYESTKDIIKKILELEEDYMRSVGIIED